MKILCGKQKKAIQIKFMEWKRGAKMLIRTIIIIKSNLFDVNVIQASFVINMEQSG